MKLAFRGAFWLKFQKIVVLLIFVQIGLIYICGSILKPGLTTFAASRHSVQKLNPRQNKKNTVKSDILCQKLDIIENN